MQIKLKDSFLKIELGIFIAIPLSLLFYRLFYMIEIGSFITSSMMELSSTISLLDEKLNNLIKNLSTITAIDLTTPLQKSFFFKSLVYLEL